MKKIVIASLLLLAESLACAQSFPAPSVSGVEGAEHPRGEHHVPPAIAAACAGKAVGTQVSVTFRNGLNRTIECGVHHHHHRDGEGNPPGAWAGGQVAN